MSVLIQSVNARSSPESQSQRAVRTTAATIAPRQEAKIQIGASVGIPDAREVLRQALSIRSSQRSSDQAPEGGL
jgi:hypothetical protein